MGQIIKKLQPRFLEKVWGSPKLSPWFQDTAVKTGEVWLESPDAVPLPLLIKFLFTTERLSIQVHPNDDYATRFHKSNGKTEMWHILRTDPGAQIALGLKRDLANGEELRAASLSGKILDLMNWIDVKPGDTFFVPAGTIHAIGSGIALCEIQQQSDVTYRLYDYGRPRELHLDHGVTVSDWKAYQAPPKPPDGALVRCEYFETQLIHVEGSSDIQLAPSSILIAIEGSGTINSQAFSQGEAWLAQDCPSHDCTLKIVGRARFLSTSVPAHCFSGTSRT